MSHLLLNLIMVVVEKDWFVTNITNKGEKLKNSYESSLFTYLFLLAKLRIIFIEIKWMIKLLKTREKTNK